MMSQKRSKISELISCNLHFTKGLGDFDFPYFSYVLTLYEKYKQGVLPFPGATADQPAQIMEFFSIFDQLDHEKQEKVAREQAAEIRKQQAKK